MSDVTPEEFYKYHRQKAKEDGFYWKTDPVTGWRIPWSRKLDKEAQNKNARSGPK